MSAARAGDLPARRYFDRQVDQEEVAGLLRCTCGEVGPRQRKPPRPRHERDIRLVEQRGFGAEKRQLTIGPGVPARFRVRIEIGETRIGHAFRHDGQSECPCRRNRLPWLDEEQARALTESCGYSPDAQFVDRHCWIQREDERIDRTICRRSEPNLEVERQAHVRRHVDAARYPLDVGPRRIDMGAVGATPLFAQRHRLE